MTNEADRTLISFNDGWKFLKLTQKDGLSDLVVETADFNDSAWELATLPHTWNAVDSTDGWSDIDEGGYSAFRFDITEQPSPFRLMILYFGTALKTRISTAQRSPFLSTARSLTTARKPSAFAPTESIPTRLTTYADNQVWGRFLNIPADVLGYNKYYGWYIDSGDNDFGKWLDGCHSAEKRGFAVSEYGGGGAISQHKDNIVWAEDIDSWGLRHYENYQSALHEYIWAQFSLSQYLWGKYVWCMFDFASDGRQEGDTKGQNDKGLVTRKREPKDAYYFYKSVWNVEPMLHLTEKRFTERPSLVPQVKAYSNAASVELFVDGVSHGTIYRSDLEANFSTVFIWKNVQLKKNSVSKIKAVAALSDGTTLEDTAAWSGY